MQSDNSKSKSTIPGKKRRKAELKNLTDTFVRNAKARVKRYDVKDLHCRGMTLRVSPTGTKTFAFMGRDYAGKVKTVTIGKYPDVSVAAAREEAYEIRRQLKVNNQTSGEGSRQRVKSGVTLKQLVKECEPIMRDRGKKIWAPRGKKSDRSTARMVIERVFKDLLEKPATSLSSEKIAEVAASYKPKNKKMTSANGQVSRGLSYLRTVFNWASGKGAEFNKLLAGRTELLELADLSRIADPAILDPKITGKRDRLLFPKEMKAILPLLVLAEPGKGGPLAVDFRPIALRFILLTLSRRSEVETLKWGQVDFEFRTWTREVKAKEEIKTVTHPLSDAAITLLQTLPGYVTRQPDEFVFPNRAGGPLGNWDRACDKIKARSKTEDWHRHDLRRSVATLLAKFGVSEAIVDTLLSHSNAFSKGKTSAAAAAYIKLSTQMKGLPDPLRDAVNLLAEILRGIESGEIG